MNFHIFSLISLCFLNFISLCQPFLPRYQFNTMFTQVPLISLNKTIFQLDKYNFGNAILSTISLQMLADTPVDQIITMLNEVNEILELEQETEDKEIYQIREECNSQLESLNNSIEFHQSLIKSLQEGLAQHESLIDATEMKEQDIKKRVTIITDMLNQEKQRNNKTVESFESKISQLKSATSTVNEALSLVEHLKADASFIQLQKTVDNIANKLTKFKSTNHQITPLLTVLSVLGQITQNGDQEALDEIIKLLNKIREGYAVEITKGEEIEAARLQKFQNYVSQLNQESMSQKFKLEVTQKEKQQYIEVSEDNERSLKFHNQQLIKLSSADERAKEFCRIKNEEYEKTTKYRSADRNALSMLIPNFKEKAKALKKYIQDRADNEF